jgi:hypothetical protein
MREVDGAITGLNEFTTTSDWLPSFDMGQGILARIDLCHNHFVGDQVQDYVLALYSLTYPQRKTGPYPGEGVQFKSQVANTIFYDKFQQCRAPAAQGILRQETQYKKPYYIARRMGISDPTIKDVTKDWVIEMLRKDLVVLRLNEHIICNRDQALEILVQEYGWNVGRRLHSHLLALQSMTREQMIARGANKQSINKDNRMIAKAGLSLALTDAKVPLPPLRIEM